MSSIVYIDYLPGLMRAVCLKDDRLQDLLILRDDKPLYIGNIYTGKIIAIDKGLDAVFVDIGLDSPGFLPRNQIPKLLRDHGLSEGLYLEVEVTREGADGKGVKLQARSELPMEKKTGLILAQDPLLDWLCRQSADLEGIFVTDAGVVRRVKRLLEVSGHNGVELKLVADKPNLFEQNGIEEAIDELLQVDISLPSGGSLIIEQGRTLSAIDVNKGTMQHNGGAEKLHYELNVEAAKEIARQLRLRNIAGRILIDFTSMKSADNRKSLQGILKAELKLDYAGHKLFPLYLSGIQELTRKRAGRSLQGLLLQPIGIGGLGQVSDPQTQAFTALRRLWATSLSKGAEARGSKKLKIVASPSVVKVLENSPALDYVKDRVGGAILLIEDDLLRGDAQLTEFRIEV